MELKGEISVEYKGNLSLFIMYPKTFPQTAPFLRIINPNPQQFTVHQNYVKYRSKTDVRSYLLNDCLQEVKSWKPCSSVVDIELYRQVLSLKSMTLLGTTILSVPIIR